MRVRFWGVRGSIPVPGPDTVRYGGDSSCVEVTAPGAPPLVLDCGSGARKLGQDLMTRPDRDIYLLFTHFHIDHVLGFPFFAPIFSPAFRVQVLVPSHGGDAAQSLLTQFLNGVFHPLRLPDIPARVKYVRLPPDGEYRCGPYTVQAVPLNHPGGSSGFRVSHGRHTMAYFTDSAPFAAPGEGLAAGMPPTEGEQRILEALDHVDLAVMDSMFTPSEYQQKMGWGHAYPEYVVGLAQRAGVRELALFHHAPEATDDFLDELGRHWADHRGPVVTVAREGGGVDLEG